MRAEAVDAPAPFEPGGRGPSLSRWLHDADLLFPDSIDGFVGPRGHPVGAVAESGWVVFHGLQVIQIVPEEVHSYWHLDVAQDDAAKKACVVRVGDSAWLTGFSLRHLGAHQHFVLTFYDELVEVICRSLLFGRAPFELERAIEQHPELGYSHFRRALALEKRGDLVGAIASLERYVACAPHVHSVDSARRRIADLHARRDGQGGR